ncbi:MAG: nucleotidyltransferase domain-containing protein [Pseudomonadota bacterium]
MISEETIQEAVIRLLTVSKPEKIFLFGSYARNDAREKSDLDFLIVKRNVKSRRKEMVHLHDALRPMRIPVDILVVSKDTYDQWVNVRGSVIYKAASEGRLCYDAS